MKGRYFFRCGVRMALLIYMVGVFALLPEYQVSADMRIAEYESDPDSDWVDQLDELISEKMSVKFSEIYELLRTGDIDGGGGGGGGGGGKGSGGQHRL